VPRRERCRIGKTFDAGEGWFGVTTRTIRTTAQHFVSEPSPLTLPFRVAIGFGEKEVFPP
jgi:hypothetical protein